MSLRACQSPATPGSVILAGAGLRLLSAWMLQIGHSMCSHPCANTAASGWDRLAVSDKKIVLGSMIHCKNFIRERIINLVYEFCDTTEV